MKAVYKKQKTIGGDLGFNFIFPLTSSAFANWSIMLLALSLVFNMASFVVQNSYSLHFFSPKQRCTIHVVLKLSCQQKICSSHQRKEV